MGQTPPRHPPIPALGVKRKKPITYPFVPRSNALLQPGHFWALPLSDGSYGCAMVTRIEEGSRVGFCAVVLDWNGTTLPTTSALRNVNVLSEEGNAHLKAITETGGSVLGLCESLPKLLPPTRERDGWGYRVPVILAEINFVKRKQLAE